MTDENLKKIIDVILDKKNNGREDKFVPVRHTGKEQVYQTKEFLMAHALRGNSELSYLVEFGDFKEGIDGDSQVIVYEIDLKEGTSSTIVNEIFSGHRAKKIAASFYRRFRDTEIIQQEVARYHVNPELYVLNHLKRCGEDRDGERRPEYFGK